MKAKVISQGLWDFVVWTGDCGRVRAGAMDKAGKWLVIPRQAKDGPAQNHITFGSVFREANGIICVDGADSLRGEYTTFPAMTVDDELPLDLTND